MAIPSFALIFNEQMDKVLLAEAPPAYAADGEAPYAAAERAVREQTALGGLTLFSASPLTKTRSGAVYGFVAPEQPLQNGAWAPLEKLPPRWRKAAGRMQALAKEKQMAYRQLPGLLLPWYAASARVLPWREDQNSYHVWLSEIMLQQTRVEAVKGYYARFLNTFPTIEALASAPEDLLLKCWEGLGYYNRARNLQKAAQEIVARHNGRLPQSYAALRALPGIGDYTAGAIASICFDAPTPAVDGNVLRVISRLTEDFASVDLPQTKKAVFTALQAVYPTGQCGAFTQSLMELGATVCVPNGPPLCDRCPAADLCMANRSGSTSLLPVRNQKRPRRVEEKTVFLFLAQDSIAVQKRSEKGLLAGLWELPNISGILSADAALQQAVAWGLAPTGVERAMQRTHIFTHVEWHMTCYVISCKQAAGPFVWADAVLRQREIALPTAFRMFLEDQ